MGLFMDDIIHFCIRENNDDTRVYIVDISPQERHNYINMSIF